jgi:hypothetical protein
MGQKRNTFFPGVRAPLLMIQFLLRRLDMIHHLDNGSCGREWRNPQDMLSAGTSIAIESKKR